MFPLELYESFWRLNEHFCINENKQNKIEVAINGFFKFSFIIWGKIMRLRKVISVMLFSISGRDFLRSERTLKGKLEFFATNLDQNILQFEYLIL